MRQSSPFSASSCVARRPIADRRIALAWLLALAATLCAFAVHAQPAPAAATAPLPVTQKPDENDPPNVLIQKAATNALDAIRRDAGLQAGSPARVNQAVDELILPYVDFETTTRLAVGRYWRQASPEQRTTLVREFRNMLVRTYGGAVANISPQAKVEVRPFRAAPDATDVVVHTLVSDESRDPIPVDYRLEKTASGWKIYDLNVLGVWFIQNYRNQFSSIASQDGVDGLIKALTDRNAQLRLQDQAR